MDVLATKLGEISGITQVHKYDSLPAALGGFPLYVILPLQGSPEYSMGGPQLFFHEVQATLFLANQLLPEAHSQAIPFIELTRNKIAANMGLDGTVEYCMPSDSAPFYDGPGGVNYNQKQYLGIIFRFSVKENETAAYTVSL
jgi:hypothetical protein